jgi:hypothetical protein
MKKYAVFITLGGLAVELIDAFTTKSGGTGGMFYGSGGYLASVNAKLPMGLHAGVAIASLGAVLLVVKD